MVWAVLVLSTQICVNLLRVFCFGCFVRVWWVHFLYFWGSGCFFYEFFVCEFLLRWRFRGRFKLLVV